jgi:hypothetical protein
MKYEIHVSPVLYFGFLFFIACSLRLYGSGDSLVQVISEYLVHQEGLFQKTINPYHSPGPQGQGRRQ